MTMADPIRFQIVDKVAELLSGIATAPEIEIMPSGEAERFPALHIFDEGQDPVEGEAGTERFVLTVGIDGYVERGDGREALAAIDSLYADVKEALFAEPVLGGLATEIEESRFRVLVTERASKRRLAFDLGITISYATRRGDPRIIQS